MKFYVDAYMADTTHLTLEEHGAYLLLLMNMWRRNGALASDDAMLARMLGLQQRAWHRLKPRLWPLLTEYGPEGAKMVTQKRLQVEWNKAVENVLRQSQRGKAGAKARYEKNQILSDSRGHASSITEKWPTITNKRRVLETSKEDTGLSTIEEDAEETSADPEPTGQQPEPARLLATPLMRRSGR